MFVAKITGVLLNPRFAEDFIFNALCNFTATGIVMILIVTHVDTFLWACELESETVFDTNKEQLKIGSQEQAKFQYCGSEMQQFRTSLSMRTDQPDARIDPSISRCGQSN